jgi:hypothetical protein
MKLKINKSCTKSLRKKNKKLKEWGPKWKKITHVKLGLNDEIKKKSKLYKRPREKN